MTQILPRHCSLKTFSSFLCKSFCKVTKRDEDKTCLFLSHIYSLMTYVSDFEHAVNTVTSGSERNVFIQLSHFVVGGLPWPCICDRMCLTRPSQEYAGITPGAPQQGKRRLFQEEHADRTHGKKKKKKSKEGWKEGVRKEEEIYGLSIPRVHHCLLGTGSILIKSSFLRDRFPLFSAHLPHRLCEVPHISPRSLPPPRPSIRGKEGTRKKACGDSLGGKKKEGPSNIKAITVRYCPMGPLWKKALRHCRGDCA